MTSKKQFLAFLSSFVLLATATPQEIAELVKLERPIPQLSIQDFAESLQQMQKPTKEGTLFQKIELRKNEKALYRDDVRVGASASGVVLKNGALRVLASYAATEAERGDIDEAATISLDEAKEKIGCEVRVDADGNTSLAFPYQTARVLVKSDTKPDMLNALDISEPYNNLYAVQFATPADAYAACKKYNEMDSVQYAAPDRVLKTCATESTPLYEQGVSWGNEAIGSIEFCKELVASGKELPEVKVAVVDTGINYEHDWFEGRIADGGFSFPCHEKELPIDLNGHGSHCSGIIVSSTPDNVKILPIQVLGDDGYGESIDIYCGMMYALEQGADVVSISLGGYGEDPILDEAAIALSEAGIPTCVAAGNEADYVGNYHPATSPDVIAVSAVDSNLMLADFSNFGDGICLAGPGVAIESAYCVGDETIVYDGTSMATPYVAACCANVLSAYPDMDGDEVKKYLYNNAIDIGEPGRDDEFGWGLVNLKDFELIDERCALPTAEKESGEYTGTISVPLSCETEGAELYYTLDGTVPTKENGIRYDGEPIRISKSTLLRIVAVLGDQTTNFVEYIYRIDGADVENLYVIEDGVLVEYLGILDFVDLSEITSIKEIGEKAFVLRENIVQVVLPDTCKTIGKNAFNGCVNLEQIVANGVTRIGDGAFKNCDWLQNADFGTLTEIGKESFYSCSSLDTATGFEKLTVLPEKAFCDAYVTFQLDSVTELGPYSLSGAVISSMQFPWKNLKKVGEFAFECTLVRNGDTIDLRTVEELGDYALIGTDAKRVYLPEDLTVIPEGLLMGCWNLRFLSAPGVKEIRDYGLALGGTPFMVVYDLYEPFMLETDIDFSAITSLGLNALCGVMVDQELHFDALEDEAPRGISGLIAPAIYLPNVKRLEPEMQMNEIERMSSGICFTADVVYLENLEAIDDYGLMYAGYLVIGDKLTFTDALFEFPEVEAVVGATESHKKLAELVGAKQIDGPSLVLLSDYEEYYCNERYSLRAAALGFDCYVRWEELNADGEVIATTNARDLNLQISEPSTKYYRYSMLDENDTVLESKKLTIEFKPSLDRIQDFQLGEQIYQECGEAVKFRYVPEESGVKNIWFTNFGFSITTESGIERPGLDVTDTFCPYEFEAGKSYIFELFDDGLNWVDCAALLIEDPSVEKTVWGDVYAQRGEWEACFFGDEPISELVVASDDRMFEADVDYTYRTIGPNSAGYTIDYVFGINDYWGAITNEFKVYDETALDREIETENGAANFYFTPETSGEYNVSFSLTEESIAHLAESDKEVRDEISFMWSVLDVYEKESGEFFEVGLMDVFPEVYTATLEAGVTYCMTLASYLPDQETELAVTITKGKTAIQNTFYEDFTYSYNEEDRTISDVSFEVQTDDGQILQEGVDFRSYWWYESDLLHQSIQYVLVGMGDYVGMLIGDGVIEEASALTIGEPFTIEDYDTTYNLHVDEQVMLHIASMTDEDGNPFEDSELILTFDCGEEWSPCITYGDITTLEPGDYKVYISNITHPQTVTLVLEALVDVIHTMDCEFDFEPSAFYTGELWQPEVTVTDPDGNILEEGVDYTIEYPNSIEPGEYVFELYAIGKYVGMYYGIYRIIEPLPDVEIVDLTMGDSVAEITEPGGCVLYRFTADSESTFVNWDTLHPATMTLIPTDYSSLTCSEDNMGFYDQDQAFAQYYEFDTMPEQEYYLKVAFMHDYATGTIPFTILGNDARRLEDCTLECETAQAHDNVQYALYYDDELLKEGEDYRLACATGQNRVGDSLILLEGMGSYFGTYTIELVKYYEELDDFAFTAEDFESIEHISAEEEAIVKLPEMYKPHLMKLENTSDCAMNYMVELDENNIYLELEDMAESCEEDEGEYPEDEYPEDEEDWSTLSCFNVLAYNSDKQFVGVYQKANEITLNPGECLYLVVLSCDGYSSLNVKLTETQHIVYGGVQYSIFNEEAYVVGVEPGYAAVVGYDTIELNGASYPVVGVDESGQEALNGCLVYCESGSDWEAMARGQNAVVIPLDVRSEVMGDLNADDCVDVSDVQILNAVIGEGKGTMVTEAIKGNGDLNADGALDMVDVMMILIRAQENI